MRSVFMRLAVVIIALACAGACAKAGAVQVGEKAPEFTLSDSQGKPVNLADLKGKVVILDFFASWCPPCREEIPDFIILQNMYAAQGFTMFGVSLVDAGETKEFMKKTGINYPVAVDDEKVSKSYGIRSIPTTYVLGKDLTVVKMYIGYQPKEVFEADIKELLKGAGQKGGE